MRLKNPNAANPGAAQVAELAGKVGALMNAQAAKTEFSAAELRALLPADAARLTDGMVSEIAQRMGWKLEQ